jgi:hypothetical protein
MPDNFVEEFGDLIQNQAVRAGGSPHRSAQTGSHPYTIQYPIEEARRCSGISGS